MIVKNYKYNSWHNQDSLNISIEQWISLLSNSDIFNEEAINMLSFVFSQPNYQSSATEIGVALNGVTQQKITALNRKIAKKLYKEFNQEAPTNSSGGKRYWNVLFDGNPECETNDLGYFIWKLRPNLIIALQRSGFMQLKNKDGN